MASHSETASEQQRALRFDERVAIVTGAGRGLGRSHALLLADRGAKVIVNDLGGGRTGGGASAEPANAVVDEIIAVGGTAQANFDDVSLWAGAEALVAQAIDAFGRIDIVIANAGIQDRMPFADMSFEAFEKLIRVHLFGTFNVVRHAWPHLTRRGYGRIILTTSSAGYLGQADSCNYSAAKAAMIGLTRTLSLEGRDHGIAVNAISPAGGMTRLFTEGYAADQYSAFRSELAESGLGGPDKVSAAVGWLAHESCNLSGEIIETAYGRMARIFVGRGAGAFFRDAPTSEQVRDHALDIMSISDFAVPDSGAAVDAERMLRTELRTRADAIDLMNVTPRVLGT